MSYKCALSQLLSEIEPPTHVLHCNDLLFKFHLEDIDLIDIIIRLFLHVLDKV